jgi:hypothetical protein
MATESFIEKQAGGIDPYARELADEELEGVAGGAGYEKAPFRCRDCHHVFFAPSTFEHYICPECNGPSDRVK